jgi:TonB-dependent SusC/RagA subfamily outer membrane receptor
MLMLSSVLGFANEKKIPSTIKEVTVYLNGAQIKRLASCSLKAGITNITISGLSTKIDESSIQVSGLQGVSILSMAYDINYIEKIENDPVTAKLITKIEANDALISRLKNTVLGLEEEEKVISSNRHISGTNQSINLEQLKALSSYYRERITAIKNAVFGANLKVNDLNIQNNAIRKQLAEINNTPQQEQGEIRLKLETTIATFLNLSISYRVDDAGWIPNYDIKSKSLNAPISLKYKAHVYQKTGENWDNVKLILSTGNPVTNVAKPNLEAKYLNFVNNSYRRTTSAKKQKYYYNPSVKKIVGMVTDSSGQPLPGCNVVVKGTTQGTQTDFDGNYSLDVSNGQSLSFSYIGMVSQEVPIYASIMNTRMEESMEALEEVIVTGYGVSRSLAGSAAGIRIRGNTSLANNNTPIYIIDGMLVDDFYEGDLLAEEIQSMEVLKGEAATTIYGSRVANGVVVITTKKSSVNEGITSTKFEIKKPYSIVSDADITVIEINTYQLEATYTYFAAPVLNENVFLTASMQNWEQYQLLPGEASVYFEGTYAGKTIIDPYAITKELVISLGIDPNVVVSRKQPTNFKSRSFTGSNRVIDKHFELEVKNNKSTPIRLQLLDRIPISQNKEIKVDDIEVNTAKYDKKKGIISWNLELASKATQKESFSYQLKYPRSKRINL